MTPDRRQSSPEYREAVAHWAAKITASHGHDYDEATEVAQGLYDRIGSDLMRDVLALLTRRAATVAGPRPAVEA